MSNESENKNDKIIDTDKYEGTNWDLRGQFTHTEMADEVLLLIAEVKRLRLLFRELINDMNADDYIEWCNKIGCPDGLEVYAMTGDEQE